MPGKWGGDLKDLLKSIFLKSGQLMVLELTVPAICLPLLYV